MKVVAVCLTSLLVLLVDDYSSVKLVQGIRICHSDCNRIIETNGTRFSSFHVHCNKLLGLPNSDVSTFYSAHPTGEQNSTVNKLLKTCSAASQLLVTERNHDVCVETKGFKIKQNATRLLVIGSKSYAIHLKTRAVQNFHFPWRRVKCLAYMRTINQFAIGFRNELATSPVSFTHKTTLRRGIHVEHITADEDKNIIFVIIYTKPRRHDLCTVTRKGINFKYLAITSYGYLKFDIDKKHKQVYVYREGKVTCYTYQGFKIKDLVRDIGCVDAMVYNPLQDVLYCTIYQQLEMITKQGRVSAVSVIKLTKSMKTHANYLYMIAHSVQDKIFVVNVTGSPKFSIIKVPKTRILYSLWLF